MQLKPIKEAGTLSGAVLCCAVLCCAVRQENERMSIQTNRGTNTYVRSLSLFYER